MWLEWKVILYTYFFIHINVYFLDTNQNYPEPKLVFNNSFWSDFINIVFYIWFDIIINLLYTVFASVLILIFLLLSDNLVVHFVCLNL